MDKSFRGFPAISFSGFKSWRILLSFALFALLSLLLLQDGISEYKEFMDSRATFQEVERNKISHFKNYTQYGTFGFRLLSIPSPLSVLYWNSATLSQLSASVDTSERMRIYEPFKGKSLFREKAGVLANFWGLLLSFGALFSLYFGVGLFGRKDFFKFIYSKLNPKKGFCNTVFWGSGVETNSRRIIRSLFMETLSSIV